MISAFLICITVLGANGETWESLDSLFEDEIGVRELRTLLTLISLNEIETRQPGPEPDNASYSTNPNSSDQGDFPNDARADFRSDLEAQLETLKAMAEKMERFGGFPGRTPPPFPNMAGIEESPIDGILDRETRPTSNFKIPEFYNDLPFPDKIYDFIDYKGARPKIEQAVREQMEDQLSPRQLVKKLVPILYGLRSGCTINLLQRLLSAAFQKWSKSGIQHLADFIRYNRPEPVDNLEVLLGAIQTQIMAEVNRTIFGDEFEGFFGVTSFITRALLMEMDSGNNSRPLNSPSPTNSTVDPNLLPKPNNLTKTPADVIFRLSRYILQCTPRTTYLQGFLSRLPNLRKRILFVEPFVFTIRVLKSLPTSCDDDRMSPRKRFEQSHEVIKNILGKLQHSLGETMFHVETALLFQNNRPLQQVFPNILGEGTEELLQKVLARLQRPGPEQSGNTSDVSSPAPSPPSSPSPSPPPSTTQIPSTTPPSQPSRRNENDLNDQSQILELLLKSLVSAKQRRSF